jgi:hypothetical protein
MPGAKKVYRKALRSALKLMIFTIGLSWMEILHNDVPCAVIVENAGCNQCPLVAQMDWLSENPQP